MQTKNQLYKYPNIICINLLNAHEEPIETLACYENQLISGGRDNEIKFWDIDTSKNIGIIKAHEKTINCLNVDGKELYSASLDGTIKKWNIETKECLLTINADKGGVYDLDISDNLILAGGEDINAKLFDKNSGELIRTFEGSTRRISGVRFYKNKVITCSWDHFIRIYDLDNGNLENSMKGHFDAINVIDVNEENNIIVSGDQSGFINIWDIEEKELLYNLQKHKRAITDLFLSENSLYSTSLDRTVRIWDIESGISWKILEGHEDATLSVIEKDNKIYSASADSTIRFWEDYSVHSLTTFKGHTAEVLGTRSKGNIIVSSGTDNLIKVWDIKDGKLIKEIPIKKESWVWGLGFDGKNIVTSSDKGIYYVYDIDSGELIKTLEGHEGSTYRCHLKNNLLITTGWDNKGRVWDLTSGECKYVLKGHNFATYTSAITDDGYFLTGSSDGTIKVWNNQGKKDKTLYGHTNEIFHISTSGDFVASASADGTCRIFNYKTGEEVAVLDEHEDQVWTVAMKDNIIATGSIDKSIKIWDLNSTKCLATFKEHKNNVKDLSISGNYLISGSFDSTIKIWDLEPYFNSQTEKDSKSVSEEIDTLVHQIQMGRLYDIVPSQIAQPDFIRFLYGMEPLENGAINQELKNKPILDIFKEKLKSWRVVGNIGFAPWIYELESRKDELGINMINQMMLGIRESPNLYWLGILRSLNLNIINDWSFDLYFSGDGPNPIEGYKWVKLSSKVNLTDLIERDENTIVFKMILKDLPIWLFPLIKSIKITVFDDRGDMDTLEFRNFLLNDEKKWETTSMFQIDQGYTMEPNAYITVGDAHVNYDENVVPEIQTSLLKEKLEQIQKENMILKEQLDSIEENINSLSKLSSLPSSTPELRKKEKISISKKAKSEPLSIDEIKDESKSKNIHKKFNDKFTRPNYGLIRMKISGTFDKFLEEIEPKFILFSAGTSIASAILTILTYIMIFNPNTNILGEEYKIFGDTLATTEIVIFIVVYLALFIFLLLSISEFFKYQRKRRRQKII